MLGSLGIPYILGYNREAFIYIFTELSQLAGRGKDGRSCSCSLYDGNN